MSRHAIPLPHGCMPCFSRYLADASSRSGRDAAFGQQALLSAGNSTTQGAADRDSRGVKFAVLAQALTAAPRARLPGYATVTPVPWWADAPSATKSPERCPEPPVRKSALVAPGVTRPGLGAHLDGFPGAAEGACRTRTRSLTASMVMPWKIAVAALSIRLAISACRCPNSCTPCSLPVPRSPVNRIEMRWLPGQYALWSSAWDPMVTGSRPRSCPACARSCQGCRRSRSSGRRPRRPRCPRRSGPARGPATRR